MLHLGDNVSRGAARQSVSKGKGEWSFHFTRGSLEGGGIKSNSVFDNHMSAKTLKAFYQVGPNLKCSTSILATKALSKPPY